MLRLGSSPCESQRVINSDRYPAAHIRARGGIGRHDGFRFHCASVQVQVLSGAPKLDTNFDTMGIMVGVQFLFVNALICKVFPIPFNENRLYGDSETVAAEPVVFCPAIPFNERSAGCAFLS